jgi:hypothetical protein
LAGFNQDLFGECYIDCFTVGLSEKTAMSIATAALVVLLSFMLIFSLNNFDEGIYPTI